MRTVVLSAIAVAGAFSVGTAQAQNADAGDVTAITTLRDAGQIDEAIATAEAVCREHPADESAAVLLAELYLGQGKFNRTIAVLQPFDTNDTAPRVARLLARAHEQSGNSQAARRYLNRLAHHDAVTGDDLFELGKLHLEARRFGLAAQTLERAEAMGLDSQELHRLLAEAYLEWGKPLGEVRIETAVGRTAEEMTDAYYFIETLPRQPDTWRVAPRKSAIYQIQQSIRAGDDSFATRWIHARIWLAARQFPRAVSLLAELVESLPTSNVAPAKRAEVHRAYADALYNTDDMDDFVEQLRRAYELDHDTNRQWLGEGYRKAANRFIQRGDLGNAIRYLELAVAERPDDAALHYRLGNASWEAGRNEQAMRHWRITLQLEPDHPDRARLLESIELILADRQR